MISSRSLSVLVPAIALLFGALGCAEDLLVNACTYTDSMFDIEEVSVLQDAFGEPGIHDAVILGYDLSGLPQQGTWRISAVDVLLMIPSSEFTGYPSGVRLGVEVFDSDQPDQAEPYVLYQTVDKGSLTWENVTLSNPDSALETSQKRAWWTFDFSAVTPSDGMHSATVVVGVVWPESITETFATVGYSNYNRPCNKNWTDYNDGLGWVLNSGYGDANTCNWPMLRVKTEVTDPSGNCIGVGDAGAGQ